MNNAVKIYCLILVSLLCSFVAQGAVLPLKLSEWNGNPLTWEETKDGLTAHGTAGLMPYNAAPLCGQCEVEAIVTSVERHGRMYAVGAIALMMDEQNYIHLALVEKPLSQQSQHFCELAQAYQGLWPYRNNLKEISTEGDGNWKTGEAYRMKLAKNGDTLTGSVESLDGKTVVFRRVVKFTEPPSWLAVRPGLRSSQMTVQYREVKAIWSGKVEMPATQDYPTYQCDSFVAGRSIPATGFFQVKQDADGSWWSYDPQGRGYVVYGMTAVRYNGHSCERLGHRCLYKEHNQKAYPSHEAWEDETLARLKAWGFNSYNGDPSLKHRGLAHQTFLGIGRLMAELGEEFYIAPYEDKPCSAFPNVYHPKFREWCAWRLRRSCEREKDNPWLYGYFTDNELAWWGRGAADTGLFDLAMAKSAEHTAKQAACKILLMQAGGNLETLNRTWKLELKSADELMKVTKLPSATAEQKAAKVAFLRQTAEIYFKTIQEEFRKIDKNHLLLGSRCAGIDKNHAVVWEMMGRYSDVITWNSYIPVDLEAGVAYGDWNAKPRTLRETFEEVYSWAKKPVIITEWAFPSLDSGLPCSHGAGMRVCTQEERAKASEIYMKTLLSMPFVLGYNAFMWVDQPPLGVSHAFPENTNYGVVNVNGVPYEPLVKVYTEIQREPAKYKNQLAPAARKVAPPNRKLYDAWLKPAFTAPKQLLSETFTATAGRFAFERKPASVRIEFSRDGKQLGTFCAMLRYRDATGKTRWDDVREIVSASLCRDDKRTELALTARRKAAETDANGASFELDYRIVVPNGADWMLWEVTAVRNLGSRPIDMESIYLRGYPVFDGKPGVNSAVEFDPVPNLYAPVRYSGWLSPDAKQYLSFAAAYREPVTLRAWFDPKRVSYHPDLQYQWPAMLAPGAAMSLPSPFCLSVVAGEGTLRDGFAASLKLWK